MQHLQGVRVLSLEQYVAGPYCTSLLADAGAEVIKLEQPAGGDPRRSYAPHLVDGRPSVNAGYVPYNRGKKSVAVDIRSVEGAADLELLLATADVLVCNLRPGAMARAGFAPERLRATYPRLIVCEISGFGVTEGERAEWPAFDSVIQATSGLSSLIGSAAGPPELAPMSTMDMLAGIYGALGILMALQGRERTGEGTHIDASMQDVGAAFLMRPLALHEFTGEVPTRGADRHSPVGVFTAGDGREVSLVIPTDDMWRRTCAAIERFDLLEDAALSTNAGRSTHMTDRIIPALARWAHGLTAEAAADALRASGQPAGVVASIADVRADSRLAERELFVGIDGFDDRIRVPRLPLLFDGGFQVPTVIVELGHDTADVLDPLRRPHREPDRQHP